MKRLTTGSKKYTPHDYQKLGIKKMISQGAAGLLLDPGLGKTSMSLAAVKILTEKKIMKGALVIAPLRACYNVWPSEIEKWADFNHFTWGILHGPDKWKVLTGKQRNFYFINPEAVPALIAELLKIRPADWPFDVLIVDESTKFKNSASQRFKALRKIIHRFRRRYILTGTPTPNGLLDLFSQIFILDAGASLGAFITHYRNRWFYSTGFGGYTWLPREGSLEEISEAIAALVLRMRAEDYLKLPPLQMTYEWIQLPPDARKVYKDLEDEFFVELGDDVVLAPNAAVAGMKCRQVLNGALYYNEEHDYKEVHDAKLDAVKDFVESLAGQPLLLFYEFNHDRERLEKTLGWHAIGQQSQKKDAELIRMFNAGLLPGLIAHPASAGHGLNLQGNCAHVGWFGLTWNLEYYDQAIKRVWRQGNNAPKVICHHFCIRNSLDEVVVAVLAAKDKNQTTFMETVRRMRD